MGEFISTIQYNSIEKTKQIDMSKSDMPISHCIAADMHVEWHSCTYMQVVYVENN